MVKLRVCVLHPATDGCTTVFDGIDPICTPEIYDKEGKYEWTHTHIKKISAVQQIRDLASQKFDVFLNLCDGAFDEERAGMEVVTALERYNCAHTGADKTFYEPSKELMKKMAYYYDIPTSPWTFIFDLADVEESVAHLRYPLIVKHYNGYSSIGMGRDSRVEDLNALKGQVTKFIDAFGGALVEEFIEGREFTVLVSEGGGRRPSFATATPDCSPGGCAAGAAGGAGSSSDAREAVAAAAGEGAHRAAGGAGGSCQAHEAVAANASPDGCAVTAAGGDGSSSQAHKAVAHGEGAEGVSRTGRPLATAALGSTLDGCAGSAAGGGSSSQAHNVVADARGEGSATAGGGSVSSRQAVAVAPGEAAAVAPGEAVAVAPGEAEPVAYLPVECVFGQGETFKHFDLKWRDYDSIKWVACADPDLSLRLQQAACRAFTALRGCSYGRCDFRVDAQGNIFFLEINPNCGIFYPPDAHGSADIILSLDTSTSHQGFLDRIIMAALARHAARQKATKVKYCHGRGYGLYATRPIGVGEVVVTYEEQPHVLVTRQHVERHWPPDSLKAQWFAGYAYPITRATWVTWSNDPDEWVPLNHSCDPNTWLSGLDLVARRPIAVGEQVTSEYATFCVDNMQPFDCRCGAASCRQRVTGQDYLTEWVGSVYGDHISDYVSQRRQEAAVNCRRGSD